MSKMLYPICQRVSCGKRNDSDNQSSFYCNACIHVFAMQSKRVNSNRDTSGMPKRVTIHHNTEPIYTGDDRE